MGVEFNKGYVTFADILGWKGIWQSEKNGEAVKNLLAIRDEMNNSIRAFQNKYFYHLIEKELSDCLSNKQREKAKKMLYAKKWASYGFDDLIGEIFSEDQNRDNINALQRKIEEFRVDISIELISDTFVITSSSKNREYELLMHCLVSQRLIITCLKYSFLIRGATSYGEFYKQELVFVGPAIDDSASWHEMGEEIGIFFTPKAFLSSNHDVDIIIADKNFHCIAMESKPMLKVQSFDTYILNWSSGEDEFNNIIAGYDTILPAIHKKVLFSKNRIEDFKNMVNKFTES